jgi:MFS family permease
VDRDVRLFVRSGLEPRLVAVLWLVSLALFFESYDVSMLTSALGLIARDLGMAEGDLGAYMGIIRLGALPALVVSPLADRLGRRRVFLATMVGMSVGTLATAFVQTPWQFVVAQMATRTFLLAGAAVALVIVAEELPAEHRGWAIGVVGALSACGHGLGALLFAAVHHLPFGWRMLYAVGIVPMLLLPMLRRGIAETARFQRHRAAADDGVVGAWWHPLAALFREQPRRATTVAAVAALLGTGEVAVFQFTGIYAQDVHGWSPPQYSTMVLLAGALGILGNVIAGSIGDRVGRRWVGCAFLIAFPLFAAVFYAGPGHALPVGFAGIVFCQSAGAVMVRALATELFPTAQRSTASGLAMLAQTLGWALGLWLAGLHADTLPAIATRTWQLALCVAASGALLLALPETSRRELEDISPEALA